MNYQNKPVAISLACLIGLTITSLSFIHESAYAFVAASWIKPVCTIGFITGLSYHYYVTLRKYSVLILLRTILLSASFFLVGFIINSVLFAGINDFFELRHTYILVPSLLSLILMLSLSLIKSVRLPPFDVPWEAASAALIPFYIIVAASIIISPFNTGQPGLQWFSGDYLVKPAIYHPVDIKEIRESENVIYTGPLKVSYSMDFIRLYQKLNNSGNRAAPSQNNPVITNFADFSGHYFFIIKQDKTFYLSIYNHDGHFLNRINNINNIYHSGTVLAALDSDGKYIRIFNKSLYEIFKIPFPPSLRVRKIVFSKELLAILYTKKDSRPEEPGTFSTIYRIDTGSRVGKIEALDIAPRIKKTGFISVDNRNNGLYITVLDRNSNKKSYLFKGGRFSNALIRQCGADRFFIRAQEIEGGEIKKEYLLVYNFDRYRKILESLRTGGSINSSIGKIIAYTGRYFLTDSNSLLDINLKKVFQIKNFYHIPYRLHMSSEITPVFEAEGSVSRIDLSPVLKGIHRNSHPRIILADMKGALIIRKVIKFSDYFVVLTNNQIFIYDRKLQLLRHIDLSRNGYIDKLKILNDSILLTFNTENGIYIYSINPDLEKSLTAVIRTGNVKLWDISENSIVYGQELNTNDGSENYKTAGILFAQNFTSGKIYEKILLSPFNIAPILVKNSLFLPYKSLTEKINLNTGKRTVLAGNIIKSDNSYYGLSSLGYIINLSTLEPLPFRFNHDMEDTDIASSGDWLDLHTRLLDLRKNRMFEVIRSGLTTLGRNSICSGTIMNSREIINCIDLNKMTTSATFSVSKNYEIVYSDPGIIFMKDNHSLATVIIGNRYN
ncbi:hypothetical protein BMS3Abin07_00664 [bacterium BMS3Abin07]|nr:hypothetical protein BMS3Abin07_00664 [bacterium BMS3Abin07]GBE32901.1 hypothetical protein BMS3Bbin05_01829 [bacterium BMS3Bbin05]HDO23198.1 hypothetical protein [Nitrospirota bacterium]